MLKKKLKSLFKPLYQHYIRKLREGLQTDEQFRLIHHIVGQNELLKKEVETLQHELNLLTILIGAIEPTNGNDAFTLTPADTTHDLINILAPAPVNTVSIVQLLEAINPGDLKNKKICLIGAGAHFFKTELEKRGATVVLQIEMNPLLGNHQQNASESIVYVYPPHIATVPLPEHIDVLFVAHPAVSAYLLKRKLFQIGAFTQERGYFILSGDQKTQHHLATLITGCGFSQAKQVPNGSYTSFDYLDLRTPPPSAEQADSESVLYVADKLPDVHA